MKRYMGEESYPSRMYKTRSYYEHILMDNGWEITHFSGKNPQIYTYSKAVIKRVISLQDWGIFPPSTKDFYYANSTNPAKYNFWDYKDAFDKALLHENPTHKHSLFIKICLEVYKFDIPIWFITWWQHFRTKEEILPDDFREKFSKWVKISPKVADFKEKNLKIEELYSLLFFTEFSNPYIWKWTPVFGYNENMIPCIKRESYSKRWDKMFRIDPTTKKILGQDTVSYMDNQISIYEDQQRKNKEISLQIISQKVKSKSQPLSKQELLAAYISNLKKDLLDFEDESVSHASDKTDASMTTSGQNVFQDAQGVEPTMEDFLDVMQAQLAERLLNKQVDLGESSQAKNKM